MQGIISFFTGLLAWIITQVNALVPILAGIAVVFAVYQFFSGIFGDDPRKIKTSIFTIVGTVIGIVLIKYGGGALTEALHAGGIGG